MPNESIRNVITQLMTICEENKMDLPPFFSVSKDDVSKKSGDMDSNTKGEKYKTLDVGEDGGPFIIGKTIDPRGDEREEKRLLFESPARVRETLRILGDKLDLGHSMYEIGPDERTLIFYYWKASPEMKKKIDDVIAFIKKNKLDRGTEKDASIY